MTVSLDGCIAGPGGEIDWSAPDEELFRFHTEQVAELGHHVCGRGLYEAMLYWETAGEDPSSSASQKEFARIWTALPKLVASTTLASPRGNDRLVRDDVVGEVAALKQQSGKDIAVGGAGLAAKMISSGLVDEFRLFVSPVVLGPALRTSRGSSERSRPS
jgi:dihydrofolate reductase